MVSRGGDMDRNINCIHFFELLTQQCFCMVVTVTVAQLNSAPHLGYSLAGEGSVSEVIFKLLTFSRKLQIEKHTSENGRKISTNAKILQFLPEVKS